MDLAGIWELSKYADDLGVIYLGIVLIASVVVKFTKTLQDDTFLLKAIKIISKYVALNRTVKDKDIRKQLQKRIDKGAK